MENKYQFKPDAKALVIGTASIDSVGRLDNELVRETSNPARIRTSFGGSGRNVAENLARLGQPVQLISAVGKDQVGKQILDYTNNSGVDTKYIIESEEHPTGSYLAAVDQHGDLDFALDDMRIMGMITPEYIQDNENLFNDAEILFVDANLSEETLNVIVKLASKHDLPICTDPISTSLAIKLKPYLPDIFLMTPNGKEAGVLCDIPIEISESAQALDAAKQLVSQGVDIAIVTLAEFGVTYATSETNGHIPAIRTTIVDPTGGGDALTAAIIFALLNNISTDEAIRLGVSAASITLRERGAVANNLSLELLYDQLII